jgi:hypothetical protein
MKSTYKIYGFLLVMISIFALCSCETTSETTVVEPAAETTTPTQTVKKSTYKPVMYDNTLDEIVISGPETEGIGTVAVTTLPVDKTFAVRRATYSYSGRVLIGYSDSNEVVVCSLNDDGTDLIEVFRGTINTSYRLLPFSDNRRILMGDYILECPEGTTLDNCPTDSAKVVKLTLPEEFSNDPNVTEVWGHHLTGL